MDYLFKASLVIFIFYVCYKLFLQRETFFQTNRSYLLIGLIASVCIPFIVIPIYIDYTPSIIENLGTVSNAEIQQVSNETSFNIPNIIFTIYGIGALFFLSKLLIELTSLKFLFNKHHYFKNGSHIFVETHNDVPPFSFFNWIVYNPSKYSQEELTHILNHEKAHVQELHSIDIILTQLTCILLWFNPFIWLYKKEIQQNLEFIADKKAQDYSECEKSYQLILLKSSLPEHKYLITNNFYNSQIKKRIIMLHKSKSKKFNAWKYTLILPLLALFLMSVSTKNVYVEIADPFIEKENYLVTEDTTEPSSDISITIITKNTTESELDEIKNQLKKEGLTVKFKGIKRNNKGEITAIKIDVKSKSSNASYNVSSNDPIEPVKIVYDENNNSISIGNDHSEHSENTFVFKSKDGNHKIHKSEHGKHLIVVSEDEHEHDEKHEHESKVYIKRNGKKGNVKTIKRTKHVEVITGDDDNEVIEIIIEDDNDDKLNIVKETIIVNGKEVKVVEGKENIIVKGNSKKVWVTNVDDKDDTYIIELDDSKKNIFISDDNGKSPLFIIDGKEVSKDEITKLDSDKIESVSVLKDKSATEKYGDKGKNGVVIITTKKKN